MSGTLPDVSLGRFRIDSLRVAIGTAPAFEAESSLVVAVQAQVADVTLPDKTITVHNREVLPSDVFESRDGRRFLIETAINCVRRMLEHEMDEWLSVDGKRWRDPHPPEPGVWTPHGPVAALDRRAMEYTTTDGQRFPWRGAGEGDL